MRVSCSESPYAPRGRLRSGCASLGRERGRRLGADATSRCASDVHPDQTLARHWLRGNPRSRRTRNHRYRALNSKSRPWKRYWTLTAFMACGKGKGSDESEAKLPTACDSTPLSASASSSLCNRCSATLAPAWYNPALRKRSLHA